MKLPGPGLKAKLDEAYLIAANPKAPVPSTWETRARKLDDCPTKTLIPVLGAALLAKSAYPAIDALSLKAGGSGSGAYSARAPMRILAEHRDQYRFYLGGLGPEPLNNHGWNQYDRIDQMAPKRDQTWINVLISWLNEVNKMTQQQATQAFAAFLRDRIAKQREIDSTAVVNVSGPAFTATDLAAAVDKIIAPVNGGRLGQSAVAAALAAAGHKVRTRRVNDPAPFDVRTSAPDGSTLLGGEIKQKPVTEAVALDLAKRAATEGCSKAVMFDLSVNQPPLNRASLAEDADRQHGVQLRCVESVRELLDFAMFSSDRTRDDFLDGFPQAFADQMLVDKVADEHRAAWSALCAARRPGSP
jgi:hypothetical protein